MNDEQDVTVFASRVPPEYPAEIQRTDVEGRALPDHVVPREQAPSEDDPDPRVLAIIDDTVQARLKQERADRSHNVCRSLVARGLLPGGPAPYGLVRVVVGTETGAVLRVLPPGESAAVPRTRLSLRQGPVEQVAVIRGLFDGIEAGESVAGLTEGLNACQVPSPLTARGGTGAAAPAGWNRTTVLWILRNEIYTGVMVFRRPRQGASGAGDEDTGPIRVEGFYPDPPVSREQFARVQERLAARARARRTRARAPRQGGGE